MAKWGAALLGPMGLNAGLFGGRKQSQPDNSAAQMFADLTRDQWANYVNTFVPIENQLIEYATDPNAVSDAMSEASQNVNQAFDAQQGALQRRFRGLGLQLTPEQQAAQDRATGLSRSLADVQAQTVARDLTTQRRQSILGNPAPQGV